MALLQDVIVALVVVAVVLLALWGYGGRWPPMVVVESESMQHSHDLSHVSVIDTGDLTLVRTLEKAGRVTTWVEGRERGYRTYDEYGDVIIYHKNGLDQTTPIIHRAIVRIEWNAGTNSFDVPSLGISDVDDSFVIEGFHTYHTGELQVVDLEINVAKIINNFKGNPRGEPHGGIITKGDHNHEVDQVSLPAWTAGGAPPDGVSTLVEPVKDGWIVGVARGEIPWFGLIKLWARGQTAQHPAPANSGYNLGLSIVLLLVAPFLAESVILEIKEMRPKEEEPRRRRRRGEEEPRREGAITFVYHTIRDAIKGKVE